MKKVCEMCNTETVVCDVCGIPIEAETLWGENSLEVVSSGKGFWRRHTHQRWHICSQRCQTEFEEVIRGRLTLGVLGFDDIRHAHEQERSNRV